MENSVFGMTTFFAQVVFVFAGRTVEVLGREAEMAVVRVFDDADGVVALPPANARDGLSVSPRGPGELATVDNGAN